MPAARSVYTINHSCDKLSWTYNSRWKTSSQTSDLATLLIAEVTFLLQMITMLVGLEWCCVLLFLLKIMPGWKIIMEVFCVFIACVISCWFGAHHAAVTQQKMRSDPHLLMLVKFSLAWKKNQLLMKPYYLGNENVPWQFSPAYPVLTQVLTFSISSSSGIWRLAHTELIQLPLWDWDWDAITLKSRNLGWRSCLIDHSHTESCGKLGNGTYQWCCTTFHRGCWTLQQLLAHCFWADLREICSAAFISNT